MRALTCYLTGSTIFSSQQISQQLRVSHFPHSCLSARLHLRLSIKCWLPQQPSRKPLYFLFLALTQIHPSPYQHPAHEWYLPAPGQTCGKGLREHGRYLRMRDCHQVSVESCNPFYLLSNKGIRHGESHMNEVDSWGAAIGLLDTDAHSRSFIERNEGHVH